MKLGWGLMTKKDALWKTVVRSKYGCGFNIIPRIKRSTNKSNLWKGIQSNWKNVEAYI